MTPTTFRLAHLSDLHLGPLPSIRLAQLMSKRILGYVGWLRGRSRFHTTAALDAIVDDLTGQSIDHTVITGDLVNIALPGEFEAAALWLRQFGPPTSVSVIPGNHDAYVASAVGGWAAWAAYMCDATDRSVPAGNGLDTSDVTRVAADTGSGATAAGTAPSVKLPYLRRAGPAAIIGLSTAVPTPAGFASGRLGQAQLAGLEAILRSLRDDRAIRIVLLHHPPIDGWSKRRKALEDAATFRQIVARQGADLVLCGHEHRLAIGAIDGPAGEVPVFGAPSASLGVDRGKRSGGYLVYRFEADGQGWRMQAEHRALNPSSGRVERRLQSPFQRLGRPPQRRQRLGAAVLP